MKIRNSPAQMKRLPISTTSLLYRAQAEGRPGDPLWVRRGEDRPGPGPAAAVAEQPDAWFDRLVMSVGPDARCS